MAIPEARDPAVPNTSSNRTEPVVENTRKMPMSMAVSPMRVTMNAFFPASAAALRSNQNAIRRYEHSPTPSQPKNNWTRLSAVTSASMASSARYAARAR